MSETLPPIPVPELVKRLKGLLAAFDASEPRRVGAIRAACEALADLLVTVPGQRCHSIDRVSVPSETRELLKKLDGHLRRGWASWFHLNEEEATALIYRCLDALETPWEGDDWDRLRGVPKKLLLYMRGRESALLTKVYETVWGKDYVSPSAVHTGVSRANAFLADRDEKKNLHVRIREDRIFWE